MSPSIERLMLRPFFLLQRDSDEGISPITIGLLQRFGPRAVWLLGKDRHDPPIGAWMAGKRMHCAYLESDVFL
jgi:hypothetical protein